MVHGVVCFKIYCSDSWPSKSVLLSQQQLLLVGKAQAGQFSIAKEPVHLRRFDGRPTQQDRMDVEIIPGVYSRDKCIFLAGNN